MRNAVFIAILFLAAALCRAQTEATTHAPKLVCDAPEFDFGTQDNSQVVEHTYVLRNAGDLTLEISNVRASCGCTVASISERSVPPGAETRVTARLSLSGRTGAQHKTLTVESNDPQQPQYMLQLKGTAATAVDVQPTHMIYGQIDAGLQPTGIANIVSGTSPFHITGLENNSDQVVATIETTEVDRAYRLVVSPREPLAPGQISTVLRLTTDHPQRPTIDYQVTYIVTGSIIVSPTELAFPAPSPEAVSRMVIVRSGNGTPFQITAVEPPLPSAGVSIEPFGPNGYRVKVTNLVASAELNGTSLKIRTDIAGAAETLVPVRVSFPPPAGN